MWIKGEWSPQRLLNFEITSEPTGRPLPARTQALVTQAFTALNERDGARAEQLLRQALAQAPDNPSVYYNLANALRIQGRGDEARQILQQLRQDHPDYLFAATDLAREYIDQGELDQVMPLLEPFLSRPRLHVSEFRALALVQVQLALARKQAEAARSWIPLLEAVDPDDPNLPLLRRQVGLG